MKTSKKASFVRIMAIILSVLMIGSAFAAVIPFLVHAEDSDTLDYPISGYNPGKAGYDSPIPMVVIMINFDADGDGIDDNDAGTYETSSAVKDKNNPAYGEQWCHTTEEDWVKNLFSFEGNTLNSYYKYMSDGEFWWEPAKESYGTADNGVIAVTIDNVHPNCNGADGNWVHCYKQIVEAASEFVDFSMYDENGNGKIDKYELCLAFILGGAETSSSSTTMREAFGFHAYYKDYDPYNFLISDGVEIGYSGFFGTGAISGGKPLYFGTFAHELGHYLGAPDMYDYDGTKYDNAVGPFSLMASGAHGTAPSHFDPYMLSEYGFYKTTSVYKDGEYTLYSKASENGDYNILKLSTPNPGEYYLIENRFSSVKDGSTFDNGVGQGILIWHIDENICRKTGMKVNNSGNGYDPGVVVYSPLNKEGSVGSALSMPGAFVSDHPTYKTYNVFKAASYNFPVSKTWYTSMTAEEAAKVENLKVTVTSVKGNEMTVKIEGVYDPQLEPEWTIRDSNVTKDSMTITGILSTLNYCTLNGATCELIEASTQTVVKTDNVVLGSNYQFEIDYTGLKPGTNYIVKIKSKIVKANATAETTGAYENDKFYTLPEPVEKTEANVTVNINGDTRDSVDVKTKVGSAVSIGSNYLVKKGYTFEGWYLDEAFTQPYDITKPIESTDDFTIWAKWEKIPTAQVTVNINSDRNTTITVETKVGETVSIRSSYLVKKGYTLEGWYLDEALTQPYDITKPIESTNDFTIWAKWKEIPATQDTTAPVTTDGTNASGGCGSSIASGAIAITAAIGLGIGFARRRKEK